MFIKANDIINNINMSNVKDIGIFNNDIYGRERMCLVIRYYDKTTFDLKYADLSILKNDLQKIYNAIYENKDCVDLSDKNEEESK